MAATVATKNDLSVPDHRRNDRTVTGRQLLGGHLS